MSGSEFDYLARLGAGGFGVVFKVRQRLDGRLYALKRVRLSEGPPRDRILREVRVLASLSHERLLRYYSCWTEDRVVDDSEDGEAGPPLQPPAAAPQQPPLPQLASLDAAPVTGLSVDRNADDGVVAAPVDAGAALAPAGAASGPVCTCAICAKPYGDWRVSLPEWSLLDVALQALNLCVDCYVTGLRRMGIDASRLHITVGGSPSATTGAGGGPAPPRRRVGRRRRAGRWMRTA